MSNSLFRDKIEEDFDSVTIKLFDSIFKEVVILDNILSDYRYDIDTDRVHDHISEVKFLLKNLKKHVSRLDNLKNGVPLQPKLLRDSLKNKGGVK